MMNPVPIHAETGVGCRGIRCRLYHGVVQRDNRLAVPDPDLGTLASHLCLYHGGQEKHYETEKAAIYGGTSFLMLGWIPVIGVIIGGIWAIILTIIGLRGLHEITTVKAIAGLCPCTRRNIRNPDADCRVAVIALMSGMIPSRCRGVTEPILFFPG